MNFSVHVLRLLDDAEKLAAWHTDDQFTQGVTELRDFVREVAASLPNPGAELQTDVPAQTEVVVPVVDHMGVVVGETAVEVGDGPAPAVVAAPGAKILYDEAGNVAGYMPDLDAPQAEQGETQVSDPAAPDDGGDLSEPADDEIPPAEFSETQVSDVPPVGSQRKNKGKG